MFSSVVRMKYLIFHMYTNIFLTWNDVPKKSEDFYLKMFYVILIDFQAVLGEHKLRAGDG